jgi:hypothetical protein
MLDDLDNDNAGEHESITSKFQTNSFQYVIKLAEFPPPFA